MLGGIGEMWQNNGERKFNGNLNFLSPFEFSLSKIWISVRQSGGGRYYGSGKIGLIGGENEFFFKPTSRKVLPTFQTYGLVGVHFAQTVGDPVCWPNANMEGHICLQPRHWCSACCRRDSLVQVPQSVIPEHCARMLGIRV